MNRHTMLGGMIAFSSVVALTASCRFRADDCDYTVRRCDNRCDWVCQGAPGYGCFFSCYDDCRDDCYAYDDRPSPVATPAPAVDGGADAADAALLCTPCVSNAGCGAGGLCIHPGGDGGTSFCGGACTSSITCPTGFTCTAIGTTQQCLPASGTCQ